jgi:hypothetical protein
VLELEERRVGSFEIYVMFSREILIDSHSLSSGRILQSFMLSHSLLLQCQTFSTVKGAQPFIVLHCSVIPHFVTVLNHSLLLQRVGLLSHCEK